MYLLIWYELEIDDIIHLAKEEVIRKVQNFSKKPSSYLKFEESLDNFCNFEIRSTDDVWIDIILAVRWQYF